MLIYCVLPYIEKLSILMSFSFDNIVIRTLYERREKHILRSYHYLRVVQRLASTKYYTQFLCRYVLLTHRASRRWPIFYCKPLVGWASKEGYHCSLPWGIITPYRDDYHLPLPWGYLERIITFRYPGGLSTPIERITTSHYPGGSSPSK